MRRVAAVVGLALLAAFLWIGTYPTQAECAASGRVVDPTERHCQARDGYVQLQEHVWFHTIPVLVGATVLVAAGYIVRRYYLRRRSGEVARPA